MSTAGESAGRPATQLVAALIVRQNHYLLGLRAGHKTSAPNCWDLIGGHVELGESLLEALDREVTEELGVTAIDAASLGSILFRDARDGASRLHLYLIETWIGGEPRLANNEHTELRWFSADDIRALPNLALDDYRAFFSKLG